MLYTARIHFVKKFKGTSFFTEMFETQRNAERHSAPQKRNGIINGVPLVNGKYPSQKYDAYTTAKFLFKQVCSGAIPSIF